MSVEEEKPEFKPPKGYTCTKDGVLKTVEDGRPLLFTMLRIIYLVRD